MCHVIDVRACWFSRLLFCDVLGQEKKAAKAKKEKKEKPEKTEADQKADEEKRQLKEAKKAGFERSGLSEIAIGFASL